MVVYFLFIYFDEINQIGTFILPTYVLVKIKELSFNTYITVISRNCTTAWVETNGQYYHYIILQLSIIFLEKNINYYSTRCLKEAWIVLSHEPMGPLP